MRDDSDCDLIFTGVDCDDSNADVTILMKMIQIVTSYPRMLTVMIPMRAITNRTEMMQTVTD